MKKGFSLIEIVMAASIFAIASVMVAAAFVQTARSQKKILLENALFEDSRFVMERLVNEIRNNTIDYEEYYNRLVIKGADNYYGKNFGAYGKKFYNPGRNAGAADAYGALCNNGVHVAHRGIPPENCVILKPTIDTNTGQNPYLPSPGDPDVDMKTATAMCENGGCTDLALQTLYRQNELYLINSSGNLKTIFALEQTNPDPSIKEFALAMVKMEGRDTGDPDDIPDTFSCSADFKCTVEVDGNKYPLNADLTDAPAQLGENFTPISPERVTIKDLHFFVSPLEDPRKAFAEDQAEIQMQPHVTIVMTIALTDKYAKQVPGENFTITLQTTVSCGVYQEVVSY